ncbi:pleckstrin homology domain-containing family G member 6 isoform X1 [Halichoerus grypus]|uniref:pleckstrin homology domain-containing family G member 6 isoform X1 n=1 Tax=Halichoerus grypus TaxID=9711 RepID=UPI00165935B2|nr:pleckstrin homology domain-containing family G member 6 isoform X1 [Halichoerus grypus]XP_035973537.1 pleckstrin homology domain-containing family G member 6 isoform X1 [Halichoerus grypus]XP_035973538.1 pleckstrin homology domain-containing family G member 6 isoform X1 [Halichoerus grypus]XP_035973539.1 pleckstrin homology domain-containing family G member 6 isoform X1 [Halichoerus grypus]
MQTFAPPDEGPLQGLVASRIETYGGRHQASNQGSAGSLHSRGGPGLDPSRRRLHGYVPFAKGSGQVRAVSPLKLREPEPEKRHGGHFGAGPPHSPKLKEVTKAHQLEVRLHTFSMFGMPRLPPEDRRHWEIGEGSDSRLVIEKSWKELVPGHKEMSRELCHQQEALWELLTTELIYVRKLRIMTDLLAAGLLNLQRVGLLSEVSAETLFGNVPSLIRAHKSFWEEVLGPTLGATRASGQPLDPVSLQNGFLTFSQRFQPYVQYCLQVKQTMAYAREQQENNPLFHAFVQWCEKHKLAGRQTLGDLLIKPHQRITKYPLLLQAVLKKSPEACTREALNTMIAAVEAFLRHINQQVRQGEEQESLVAAAQRIGPYEVLEPSSEEVEKNLRPFCTLDLMSPVLGVASEHTRQLLLEGPVRVKEGREGKLDVYLFLFSDVLLVTKPQRKADKAKVIRPPLMLEKLVCQPLRDPNSFLVIHLTEFHCVSSALIVHCPSAADRAQWLEKTQQAQVTLQKLKAEEYVQQKRELLALYRDQDQESPGTGPSSPSPEGSQSSAERRTPEFSTIIPHLVVTEDTDEDSPLVPDDTSDSGYSTLIPGSPKGPHYVSHLRPQALRRDPRLTFSTLDLRDVPLRPQPPNPQAPQRRSIPELPREVIRRGSSLPRGDQPTWSEEEDGTSVGGNVVAEILHRARLRGQLPPSPTHTDSAGESPWESSGDEEEGSLFLGPGCTLSPHPLRAEDMLREIREELASQRIEGIPEPGNSKPRKLTRGQLQRMRGPYIIQLDTPLSTSEV